MSRNSSSVALQSLTATYSDSEGEDELNRSLTAAVENGQPRKVDDAGDVERKSDTVSFSASPASVRSGINTPQSGSSATAAEIRRVAARLVSYNNDEAMSDDNMSEEEDSGSRVEFPVLRASRPASPSENRPVEQKLLPGEELLPPEPTGRCAPELEKAITILYERMLNGLDVNAYIQNKKEFRNPSIYKKLIEFLTIDEKGTNFPPDIYDPKSWGEESYYEALAKVQKEEMERKERERKDRTVVEHVSGTAMKKSASSGAEDERPRKSKWDQGGPQHQVLTTVVTGTKTKVISAFGAIAKKPKL